MSKNQDPLFSDFPKVSREEWIQKATTDLKGKDVLELYSWELEPGIALAPYYDQSDLEKLENYEQYHNRLPATDSAGGTRVWKNLLTLQAEDEAAANKQALKSLNNGVEGIIFEVKDNTDLEKLLNGIPLETASISFKVAAGVDGLSSFLNSLGTKAADIQGSVEQDAAAGDPLKLYDGFKAWKGIRTFMVQSQAAALTSSVAESLQQLVELIDNALNHGIELVEVLKRVTIVTHIGTDYFGEIAKLRALRRLAFQISQAYGADAFEPEHWHIRAVSNKWINEDYQPHGNLLKSTTATMAAILGGCNELVTEPEEHDAFSIRIAQNVSSILNKESFLGGSVDPVAGSYYLESLADSIARQSWDKFKTLLKKEMTL